MQTSNAEVLNKKAVVNYIVQLADALKGGLVDKSAADIEIHNKKARIEQWDKVKAILGELSVINKGWYKEYGDQGNWVFNDLKLFIYK